MNGEMTRSTLVSALALVAAAAMIMSAGCQQATRTDATYPATGQPRLVELGTAVCIPCMMMAPVLNELETEYAGRLQVESIETALNPGAKTQYDAPYCATQIFIDASGKELFRHVGFFSKQDILAKWKELGIDLSAPAGQKDAPEGVAQPKAGNA